MATLYIIATPIGNLEDLSYRAVRILGEVGVLACEDTRTTRVILERYAIRRPPQILSYREHNEANAAPGIVKLLAGGSDVALCSDAGYPGISDPGYRVIAQALDAGHRVEVLPGAGAVEPAVLASGLPPSSFTFKGFPPRKPGPRTKYLTMERDVPHTLVFFESPRRLASLLQEALGVYGDRRAAVCIELTKKFEEVHRGWLSDLCAQFRGVRIRGEVTLVIAGSHPKFVRGESQPAGRPTAPDDSVQPARARQQTGKRR